MIWSWWESRASLRDYNSQRSSAFWLIPERPRPPSFLLLPVSRPSPESPLYLNSILVWLAVNSPQVCTIRLYPGRRRNVYKQHISTSDQNIRLGRNSKLFMTQPTNHSFCESSLHPIRNALRSTIVFGPHLRTRPIPTLQFSWISPKI